MKTRRWVKINSIAFLPNTRFKNNMHTNKKKIKEKPGSGFIAM